MKKYFVLNAAIAMLAILFQCVQAADCEEGFVPLFNGQNLTGWKIRGGYATYKVEDGTIVGTCVPDTPGNTFLCTEKDYGNFILKFQTKFIEDTNSGCQFRSETKPDGDRERVFGYQCELEPGGGVSGRIFDEGRRGFQHGYIWLDLNTPWERCEAAREDWKAHEWNDVEIQAIGPSLKTWINGHLITDMYDCSTMKGLIGFQVHEGKSGKVAWKNIRIKDMGESKWKPFFIKDDQGNGKLNQSRFVLPEEWSFDNEEGVLHGVHKKSEKRDALVISNEQYDNFAVRVTYKMIDGNSGLCFRSEEVELPTLHLQGFQNEIANNAKDSALWHSIGRWVAANDEIVEKVRNKEGWNTICTIAVGDRLVQTLNGFCTSDIENPLCEKTGKLGLQMDGRIDNELFFKDWEVMELTSDMVKLIERK